MLRLSDEHTSEQHVCIVMFAILHKTVGIAAHRNDVFEGNYLAALAYVSAEVRCSLVGVQLLNMVAVCSAWRHCLKRWLPALLELIQCVC